MKRYIIYSNYHTGDAELLYCDSGKLLRIDVSKAVFEAGEYLIQFKALVPIDVVHLVNAFEGFATRITEGEITISFEQFWKKYDKKINKARCLPMWNKLPGNEQVKAFTGIDKYNAYLKKETWRSKLDPENYLKNKTWENEYK
jgi:hypothetical protein